MAILFANCPGVLAAINESVVRESPSALGSRQGLSKGVMGILVTLILHLGTGKTVCFAKIQDKN